jgi:tRNA-dihydrouridine synthase A
MMDWTDRHCRVFHRALTHAAMLYTEMVTAQAIIHGNRDKLLGFDAQEHPVALQLGGSDPLLLAEAAKIGEGHGYDEINLNVGCPSDRVQGGHFGACLMAEPEVVAECFAALQGAVKIPVTIKCRIGIDDQDEETALDTFVGAVTGAGCKTFIIHARKAWLQGLSPKENREIPPLNYDRVLCLKAANPSLHISLNGGLETVEAGLPLLDGLDGVMLGRAAYHNPWILTKVDPIFSSEPAPAATRREAALAMLPYIEKHTASGAPLHHVTRHMLGLYHGQPGGRLWRQILTVEGQKRGAEAEVIIQALDAVEQQAAKVAA